MSIFSTPKQLARLQRVLFMCLRLPFSQGAIPGRVLEEVLAEVRSAKVLPTYDFVDVINTEEACGWQIKSTKAATPVTWKRAKLPNVAELIGASMESEAACQELGDAIIGLCNEHAQHSLTEYELEEIASSCTPMGRSPISRSSYAPPRSRTYSILPTSVGIGPIRSRRCGRSNCPRSKACIEERSESGGHGMAEGRTNSTSPASPRGGRMAAVTRCHSVCHRPSKSSPLTTP